MLKFMVKSLDGLDEEVAKLYTKHEDGNFYLEVEGAVAKAKIDEFRDNNINLKRQIDELTGKLEGVDLDEYRALKEAQASDDGKKRITMEKVDEIVAERTKKMREEHDALVSELTGQTETLSGQLNGLLIDGAVRQAAIEAKVRPGALEDVVLRAQRTFKVVDGKAVAHDEKGNVQYGKDGASPLQPSEWIDGLKKNADHLFEQSSGGGAGGGGNRGGAGNQDTTNMSSLQKISAGLASSE